MGEFVRFRLLHLPSCSMQVTHPTILRSSWCEHVFFGLVTLRLSAGAVSAIGQRAASLKSSLSAGALEMSQRKNPVITDSQANPAQILSRMEHLSRLSRQCRPLQSRCASVFNLSVARPVISTAMSKAKDSILHPEAGGTQIITYCEYAARCDERAFLGLSSRLMLQPRKPVRRQLAMAL